LEQPSFAKSGDSSKGTTTPNEIDMVNEAVANSSEMIKNLLSKPDAKEYPDKRRERIKHEKFHGLFPKEGKFLLIIQLEILMIKTI
jgi:hypothetical protein